MPPSHALLLRLNVPLLIRAGVSFVEHSLVDVQVHSHRRPDRLQSPKQAHHEEDELSSTFCEVPRAATPVERRDRVHTKTVGPVGLEPASDPFQGGDEG